MLCISKPDSSLGHIEPVFATMVYKMYFSLKFFQLWFISVSTSAKAVLLQLIRQRAATVPILSRTRSAGVRKFIVTLSAFEHHCVMEATGNYGFLLLYLLHQGGIAVSLVNPKQIKHFAHDGRYQDRRERRLHDRHVWGENESSYLQNALASYHSAQTEEDRNPSTA